MPALRDDLRRIVGAESVSDDPADRSAYAHDLWPRQLIATRAGASRPSGPSAVVWPGDRDQLLAIVRYARSQGLRLTPFGAGSAVTGALALGPDSVAVDMKRMRRLVSVDRAAGVAVADCGMLGEHLERQLERRGATLGHFPSSIYCSTLGGWIATRSAGQCSGRYGKIEDMVVALEGVLPTGELFECGPPRPGEIDVRPLLVGSEGLFGFFTRAVVRIWPAVETRRYEAFTFGTLEQAWTAVRAIYQSGLRPAVARLYDPFDTQIFKTGGARTHRSERDSAGRRRPLSEYVLRRALAKPHWINRANESWGAKLFGRSLLVLVWEGTLAESLDDAAEWGRRLAREHGGRDEGDALARRWIERRHAVSYRQPPAFARGIWTDTMEVAAPWSALKQLFEHVHAALGEGGFVMAHLSHAYPDGCSIYFTFAGASPDDHQALETYLRTWDLALRAAHFARGTIAHHHGIGRSKRGAMRLELGAGVDVIDALARAADPGGVMARGPLVPDPDEGPPADTTPTTPGLDTISRLYTVRAAARLEDVHRELASRALYLPDAPSDGTVAGWLAKRTVLCASEDPVDHLIAGYGARLPSGAIARVLPVPRRAAGPDLFPLFSHPEARYGELEWVTLRVRGADETAPAWKAPCHYEPMGHTSAVGTWLTRFRLGS